MFDSLLGAANETTKEAAEGPAPIESVGSEYLNLRAEIDRLEAQAVRLLARCDTDRTWQADGYASTTAWLTHRARMRRGRARRLVVEARALAEMPDTAKAFVAGGLSTDQTAELIRVRNAQPDEFPAYEQTLVGAAQDLGWVSDLRTACDYWQQAAAETLAGEIESRVDDLINGEVPPHRGHGRGFRGHTPDGDTTEDSAA